MNNPEYFADMSKNSRVLNFFRYFLLQGGAGGRRGHSGTGVEGVGIHGGAGGGHTGRQHGGTIGANNNNNAPSRGTSFGGVAGGKGRHGGGGAEGGSGRGPQVTNYFPYCSHD